MSRAWQLTLLVLLFSGGSAYGQETLACAAGTVVGTNMTFTTTNFTLAHSKGLDANFASYSPWRIYTDNTVTFTGGAAVGHISSIVITASTNAYASAAIGGTQTILSGTGSVTTSSSGSDATITISGSNVKEIRIKPSAQSRWSSITINYVGAGKTVTFNGNGSTSGSTAAQTASSATALTANGFIRTGYTFSGWDTVSGGGGAAYADGASYGFGADMILYAQWTAVSGKTVTFDANGGAGTMTPQNASVATNLTSNSFIRTGYSFANWNTASDGTGTTYSNGQSYDFSANITLYARWTPTNNTVTFNGNGNTSGLMSNQTIATAATAALTANAFTRTGYTFANWNTLADGTGTNYANAASYTMGTANVTLYAKWTPNNNTVTFDGNGSTSGSMINQTIATAATASLTTNAYIKTGYTFAGWNTVSDGTGTSYADGASYSMGTSNVTLYAKWNVYVGPWEDFETGTKGAYASGSVTCTAGSWTMNDALIGSTGSDRKNGSSSVRLQNSGFIQTDFDITSGVGIVKIQHAKYGGDGNSSWRLVASTNGGSSWDAFISGAVSTTSTTLTEASFTLNLAGTVRLRIEKTTTTNKTSIDDIYITSFASCTPPSTSATALTVNTPTLNSLNLNFTRGDGDGVLIIAKAGATPATAPSSGTSYSVSDAVGGGIVVYKGTASGALTANLQTISSLLQSTQYQFSVYEYVSVTNCYQAVALLGNGTTKSPPSATLAGTLSENTTLNGGTVVLTLANETFLDATLVAGNFTLNNAPTGVTISGVVYNSTTQATLTLAYDGTDFDSNVTTVNVTISNTELTTSIVPLVSGNITITAVAETVTVGAITSFGNQCLNVLSGAQTFTISGTNLKAGNIALTALSGFTYSETVGGTYTSTLSFANLAGPLAAKTIYVKFLPTTATSYNGNIVVSSAGAPSINRSVVGTGLETVAPSVTSGAATLVGTTTATLNASNSTFGVCPSTTEKGFVYSVTGTNSNPLNGGTGVTKITVGSLGAAGAFTQAVSGLTHSTPYSFKPFLFDGTTYTYGVVNTFTTATPPANDDCSNAITLTVNAAVTNGTLAASTFTTPFDKNDVWYKFTPTCNGSHSIIATAFTGDVDIYLFNQSSVCPSTTITLDSSAGTTATETITSTLTSGITYFVRVRAWNTAAEAPFTIQVTGAVPVVSTTITPTLATTCVGVAQTYTAATVANATSYTWSFPNGWVVTTPSTTNVISVTPSATAGNVSVIANNCYGSGIAKTLAVTPSAIPATPGAITGNAVVCSGTANTYSVVAVSGATSYTWTLPGIWTGTSTTASISTTADGDSGNITVTANNACGSSATQTLAVTVNPFPVTPGIPTSNSPQCAPTGVTLNRTGSVPAGEAWFWQTTATGTAELAVNAALTYNATSSGTIYIRSKNTTTGCWSVAASLTVVVNSTISTLATVPSPTNNNAAVCYSGIGAITSLGWTNATGATSYDVYFGAGSIPSTVTANVATNVYSVGALLGSTTYYWKVVPKNGCGATTGTVINWRFTTQGGICSCTSVPSSNDNSGITNVVVGSANFPVSDVTYLNYTASIPNLVQSSSVNSSITFATGYTYNTHIWIDFNDDGVFNNTNEKVFSGESLATNPTTYNTTFTLGGTSAVGIHKMRIGTADNGQATATPCYSGTFGVTIDLMVNIMSNCTPVHTITSFSPTSGPVGTIVTVIGTGFVGTTAKLGSVNVAVIDLTPTQLKVAIPAGAITSDLMLTDNVACPTIVGAFTVINKEVFSCEDDGGTNASDLFIYEVQDEFSGTGGAITLFNRSGATVNLSDYEIHRAGNYGAGYTTYGTLSGSIAKGAIAVIAVNGSPCGYVTTGNGELGATGFNGNDGFQLIKAGVVIDDVKTPFNDGYYIKRKSTNLTPNVLYTESEWIIQSFVDSECIDGVGTSPFIKLPPAINTQPSSTAYSCASPNVSFSLIATEGFTNGLPLAYQWYLNQPGNTGWSAVSGTDFSGETTATLTVSNPALYEGYQFYAQVRENTATCYKASEAVGILGDSGTITYAAGAWVGGLPTDITKIVVIDSGQTYNTTAGPITARRLINNGTIIVNKAHPVIVDLDLENNGTFEILDDASFVQNCNVENEFGNNNVGQIKMVRETPDMFRYDFTYWSSPVKNFVLKQVSPFTLFDKFFSWDAMATPQVWKVHKSNLAPGDLEKMQPGRGYTVRAPQSYNVQGAGPAASHTANFIGIPNNGTVTQAIAISNDINVSKWNLVGNPYPSAIDGKLFLAGNTNLGGTLYFWTHNSSPTGNVNGYYSYNTADYAAWNIVGQVQTCGTCTPPAGSIAAGQSFFVKGIGTGANPKATFNNAMRPVGNNTQFYKPSPTEVAAVEERHRVWLNLTGATKGFNQALIGYVYDATNGLDNRFDGESFGGNEVTLYSVLDTKKLVIQGRALPFLVQDVVPLGYKTTLTGNLTISIDHADGLLLNQAIYLEDTVLNVTHNLTTSNYVFASVPGTFNSRFVLRYLPQQDLANPTFEDKIQGVTIRKNNADLHVNSPYELIDIVRVYDITGRLVFERKQCNSNRFDTSHIVGNDQTLIVKVQLVNGGVVTQKVY